MILGRVLRTALNLLNRSGSTGSNLGSQGEDLAYWYLREHGFTMVARNYRHTGSPGEIDLIGWDGGTLVFVEVKARQSSEVRRAEDAVNAQKRRHLVTAAREYRHRAGIRAPYRFDVVSIHLQSAGKPLVEHFREAFCEADAVLL